MQVLMDVNSLSARRQKTLHFFFSFSSPGNWKKLRCDLFKELFLHTEMAYSTDSHSDHAFKISAYSPQPRLGADN